MAKKPTKKNVFVGREKEIDTIKGIIKNEPKANILISGVTGMGKTELCIQMKKLLSENNHIHCGSYRVESKLEDPVNPFLVALLEVFESVTHKEPAKKELKWFKNVFAKELWKKRKGLGAAVLKDGLGSIVKNLTEKIEVGETSSEIADILKDASSEWSTKSTLDKLLMENKEAVITTYLGILRQMSEQSPDDHKFVLIFDQVENTAEVFQQFLKSIARNVPHKFFLLIALNSELPEGGEFLKEHVADWMHLKTRLVRLTGLTNLEIRELIVEMRGLYKAPDEVERVRRLSDGRPLMIIQWINSRDFDLSVIDEQKLSLYGYFTDALNAAGTDARRLAIVLSLLPFPLKGGLSDYAGIMGMDSFLCYELLEKLESNNIIRKYPEGWWFSSGLIQEYIFNRTDQAIKRDAALQIIDYLGKKYRTEIGIHQPTATKTVYAELLALSDRYQTSFDQNLELGRYHYSISAYEAAKRHFENALKAAELLGDPGKVGLVLNAIGLIYDRWGKYDLAIACYEKSLRISEDLGDREGIAMVLNNIGQINEAWGKYDQATEYYKNSLKIRQEVGDRQGEGVTLNNIGEICWAWGKYDQAIEYYKKSLKISEEVGDRQGEGVSLNNIGSVYDAWGKYDQAIEYYKRSLKISEEVGDRQSQGVSLNNVGSVYKAWGKYDQAIEYYKKSLKIREEIGDRRGEGVTLNSIGTVYDAWGKYDQAIGYYTNSSNIFEEIGDRRNEAVTLSSIGRIHERWGSVDRAIEYYEKSLSSLEEIGLIEAAQVKEDLKRIQKKMSRQIRTKKDHKVFLSYASPDTEIAQKIADEVRTESPYLSFEAYEFKTGEAFADTLQHAISPGDYLVVLLSQGLVNSRWVKEELTAALMREFKARDITVLCVRVQDCETPSPLASHCYLDLRTNFHQGLKELAEQLKLAPHIEFSRLGASSFEELVIDLLATLGFSGIKRDWRVTDSPFYYVKGVFSRKDPFGTDVSDTWLVRIKFHLKSRVDLKSIDQLTADLSVLPEDFKGLLVTNGTLTSTALQRLRSMESQRRIEIGVLDGTDLKRLLLRHKDLVFSYFGTRLESQK